MPLPAGVNVSLATLNATTGLTLFYGRVALTPDPDNHSALVCTFYLPTLDTSVITPVINATIDYGDTGGGPFPQGSEDAVIIYNLTCTPEGNNLQYVVVSAQTVAQADACPCWCNLTVIAKPRKDLTDPQP